jgi:hypothetical protein
MANAAKKPQRNLAEDIRLLRADLDVFIAERVAEMKKSYPLLPIQNLHMELTRHRSCQCQVVQEILEKQQNG